MQLDTLSTTLTENDQLTLTPRTGDGFVITVRSVWGHDEMTVDLNLDQLLQLHDQTEALLRDQLGSDTVTALAMSNPIRPAAASWPYGGGDE